MSYVPTKWENGKTPINAQNLNKMEEELARLSESAEEQAEATEKVQKNLDTEAAAIRKEFADADVLIKAKIEEVNKSLSGSIADLYQNKANAIIQKASGSGSVCIKDTAEAFVKITPYGNTEQDGTTGAQLFDASALTKGSNDSLTISNDGYDIVVTGGATTYASSGYNIPLNLLRGKTVYIMADSIEKTNSSSTGRTVQITVFSSAGNKYYGLYVGTELSASVTIPEDVTGIDFAIYSNGIGTALSSANTVTIKGLRLAESADAPWEKFTGGQASPNPDYPCEIKPVKGKNELDCRGLVEQTFNGVKFTPVKDEHGNLLYIEANGTATADATYTLNSAFMADTEFMLNGCNGGAESKYFLVCGGVGFDTGNGLKISADNVTHFIGISVKAGVTADHVRFYPMIRKATISDDTYVPYGLLRFKTKNAQLIEPKLKSGSSNGVTVTYNENGTYALNGTATADATFRLDQSVLYGVDNLKNYKGVYTASIDGYVGENITLILMQNNTWAQLLNSKKIKTAEIDKTDCFVYIWVKSGSTFNNYVIKPMLNEGTEALPWQPYTENSITLSEPIELNGIGEVKDGIVEKDGMFGVERKFAEVVLDGSTDENWREYDGNGYHILLDDAYKTSSTVMKCKSNLYSTNKATWTDGYFGINSGTLWVANKSGKYADLSAFKNFLAENNMEVIYELAEPTFEPLPTADQIALRSLMSYDGVTYIECDSEVEPVLDVECVLDTKMYIDRKFNELAVALVATGSEV